MVTRDYECSRCLRVMEIETPIDHGAKPWYAECPACGALDYLERVWLSAPAVSFGGRSGAVRGSGFHSTDYSNPKSDLLKGRALEHQSRIREVRGY